jgi:hypothetical protein
VDRYDGTADLLDGGGACFPLQRIVAAMDVVAEIQRPIATYVVK